MYTQNKIIGALSQQWRPLICGLLLSLVCGSATVALLSVSGWLICSAAIAGTLSSHAMMFNYFLPAACIRFFALIRIMSRYGERVINHQVTFNLLRNLRIYCYNKLEPLAPAHFQHHQSGDLLQRFINDIDQLNHAYLRLLSPLVISSLLVLICGGVLLMYNSTFAWLLYIAFGLTLTTGMLLNRRLNRRHGQGTVKRFAELRAQLLTALQAHRDILLFGLRSRVVNQYCQTQAKLKQHQLRMGYLEATSAAVLTLIMGATLMGFLIFGLHLVAQHRLHPALLGMLVLLLIGVFEILSPLPLAFQRIGQTLAAGRRITELTQSTPLVRFPNNASSLPSSFHLQFNNVCFHYPGHRTPLLQHLQLTVAERDRILIRGESGVGKSTLGHLMTRSWDPASGSIFLGQKPLHEYSECSLRQTICMATQRTHVFNSSIRKNLLIANPLADDRQLQAVLHAVQLDSTKQNPITLDTELGEFGQRLSGGQIKRLGIARALLSPARIIILDEPSEGLDPTTDTCLWQRVEPFLENRSVIVISHLPLALKTTTHVLINGSLQTTTHEKIS